MKRKRSSVEQIVTVVKQHEMGDSTADTGRKLRIAEQTFHRWKKQYGDLEHGLRQRSDREQTTLSGTDRGGRLHL